MRIRSPWFPDRTVSMNVFDIKSITVVNCVMFSTRMREDPLNPELPPKEVGHPAMNGVTMNGVTMNGATIGDLTIDGLTIGGWNSKVAG